MNNYDLSVLIPARNEMFVAKTAETLLRNKRGNTEVIVVLDGQWTNPPLKAHKDLTIIYVPESIGQRAATNMACRVSRARYVMKLDAHCSVDEGFDVKMIESIQGHEDEWTMIPKMYNLHAFDWVCIGQNKRSGKPYEEDENITKSGCGYLFYQGPTPEKCEKCGGNMERLLRWNERLHKESLFYRFDTTLHFYYHGQRKSDPESQGDIVETMSAQGSCFFLSRKRYWELNISDEKLAGKTGWGQQGVEVALKSWLSGGKLMTNKNTWYAHMFRTQGGDFGFPYYLSGHEVDQTRQKCRDLWFNNKWEGQKLPLSWLLEKFYPVPDWHYDAKDQKAANEVLERVMRAGEEFYKSRGITPPTFRQIKRGIVFYTDNKLNLKIAKKVQNNLRTMGIPIVSASLKPMNFGRNIHLPLERGVETYFKQIITALENSEADIIYFCEHDVVYHPSHFEFIPPRPDKFYYNQNFWRIREDGFAVHWDANQVSGLVCYRQHALNWYKSKFDQIKRKGFDRSYEPGGRDPAKYEVFKSEYPNIDVRHGGTLTKSKWSIDDFRDKSTCKNWQEGRIETIPGWDLTIADFYR